MTKTNPEVPQERSISWPRILRLKATLESVRAEVRDLTPDAKSLERLATIQNTIQAELGDAVSMELEIELAEFASCCEDNPSPTPAEIRVAQAQLAGWIQGLLNGVVVAEASTRAEPGTVPSAEEPEESSSTRAGYV